MSHLLARIFPCFLVKADIPAAEKQTLIDSDWFVRDVILNLQETELLREWHVTSVCKELILLSDVFFSNLSPFVVNVLCVALT